jgi:sugar phosphate isomerase/epimerase
MFSGGKFMNRREFLVSSAAATAVVGLTGISCSSTKGSSAAPRKRSDRIAFNTANLVGRVSGYRYELKNWGEQHQRTVASTDSRAWESICADIAREGYEAVEIWEAHAAPEVMDIVKAKTWRRIMEDHGLQAVAYAGGLRKDTLLVCQWLGIPHIDGGLRGLEPAQATALCREYGIRFNLENHPERSVQEILKPIAGGNEWLGVCVDTGWLGTQRVDAPEVIRQLGSLVRHTHIKDVKKAGAHETCRLGDGVVNIPSVLVALRKINYQGWYSWEDEPEDRNPLDLAKWSLNYIGRMA